MFARTASGSAVTGSMVSQSTMATALQGVDVASFQHPSGASIDWSEVAAGGIQFAAVKATEGAYYENPYALTDLADAKAAGLSTVAYAFAIPNGNSTIANSGHFATCARSRGARQSSVRPGYGRPPRLLSRC